MDEHNWYGVKCLVEHKGLPVDPGKRVYEERIVLLRASGFGEAIRRAERAAVEYATPIGATYIGYCNAFQIAAGTIEGGVEVYSLMREVVLTPEQFIAHYHDDGTDKGR
jgi:hypothetical protein